VPVSDQGRGYGELSDFTSIRVLPYPGDMVGSVNTMRNDRLNVLVNINGWCDNGANDVLTARVAPLQVSYMVTAESRILGTSFNG